MPTYLMLSTLTPQGVQTLKANPSRLREVNQDVEELGAKVLHQWATLGEYDFVNIVEAPDAATVAKISLALGARGSAKLQSLELVDIDTLMTCSGPAVELLLAYTLVLAARNAVAGRDTFGVGSAALLGAWCGLLANSAFVDTLHWRHLWLVAALIWVAAMRTAR